MRSRSGQPCLVLPESLSAQQRQPLPDLSSFPFFSESIILLAWSVKLIVLCRCLTDLSLTISKTTALEDRRLRRDLQDTYAKALDLVVNNSLKMAEAGIWDRPDIAKRVDADKENDIDVEKGLVKVSVLEEEVKTN